MTRIKSTGAPDLQARLDTINWFTQSIQVLDLPAGGDLSNGGIKVVYTERANPNYFPPGQNGPSVPSYDQSRQMELRCYNHFKELFYTLHNLDRLVHPNDQRTATTKSYHPDEYVLTYNTASFKIRDSPDNRFVLLKGDSTHVSSGWYYADVSAQIHVPSRKITSDDSLVFGLIDYFQNMIRANVAEKEKIRSEMSKMFGEK